MQYWPTQGNVRTLPEWQKTEAFANLIRESCAGLQVSRDREWLLEGLRLNAERMTDAIDEAEHSDYLAEYILRLDSVRGALAIIDYYVDFMRYLELVPEELSDRIMNGRAELDDVLATLAHSLRGRLNERWGFSKN